MVPPFARDMLPGEIRVRDITVAPMVPKYMDIMYDVIAEVSHGKVDAMQLFAYGVMEPVYANRVQIDKRAVKAMEALRECGCVIDSSGNIHLFGSEREEADQKCVRQQCVKAE